ncbi:biotin/lipoyl-binding carrier protein [Sporosarcina sp. ACRSL]|uniref:biotin/lipoyl-binding carrier protein n=1 Tax=Sporosarcina sp. ACRSL TaxID=2918215 RepID=UPI001EF5F6CB|nr:biotin/lipoyl-binding carrier protein [Sporosarcina sp. ACRSL]MCG7342771.1 biotin/lipoyl-binding carrier protein [Sporosarcina sp. ACRSL]
MTQVKAAMAGTVFTVNVAVGDEVRVGQTIIVLESMKMEIPVETEVSGNVASINVQVGDFVNEEDVLAVIEG